MSNILGLSVIIHVKCSTFDKQAKSNFLIQIRQLSYNSSLGEFIDFPYDLYKDSSHWVPPLRIAQKALFDLKRNPFWKLCDHAFFLAYENGRIVGRIAAFVHYEYLKINPIPTAFFGFLEGINKQEVFRALLQEVEEWSKARNCTKIIGPVNPSINYELGTLIEGFDMSPYLMMTFNHAYYPKLIDALGYSKEMDFFAYYTGKNAPTVDTKLDRIIELTKRKYKLELRKVVKNKFTSELQILYELYHDAFAKHYGFVPMIIEEFEYMGKDLRQIVDEDFLLIAEYNNEPIGFLLALPNYNEVFAMIKNGRLFPFGWYTFIKERNRIKSIRILTIAVKPKFQHMGIGAYLYKEVIDTCKRKGIIHGEMSWIAEENVQMNKAALEMGAQLYKRYRLYFKQL